MNQSEIRTLAYEQAVQEAYTQAIQAAEIQPYGHAQPDVEMPDEELDPDEGFTFKATVPLDPRVTLGDLEGLAAKKVVVTVRDDEVEAELARMTLGAAEFAATEDPAADGDRVRATVTFDGRNASVPAEDAHHGHTHDEEGQCVIGEMDLDDDSELDEDDEYDEEVEEADEGSMLLEVGANLDEFDKHLRGVTVGEERAFDFAYPADHTDPELAGKTVEARVIVHEVLQRSIPQLDDGFAAKYHCSTADELRLKVHEVLQAAADRDSEERLRDDLVREVVRRAEVHFPEEMLQLEIADRSQRFQEGLEARGVQLKDFLASRGASLQDLQGSLARDATESLRNSLVLIALGSSQELEVTPDEIEAVVRERALARNVKVAQMRRVMADTGEITAVQNRLYYEKIAEFLKSQAQIVEVQG